jgi:predicted dehydrogenase
MAKTLRVGLIGYGFMGKAHSNAWRQAPYFFPLKARTEMHTICGRTANAVQAARAQLGWQFAATDWREVVESPLIDIIDISTPNDSHAEIAIAAARAGKHLLCEKPLALNLKQAEAMLVAAQKAKVVHMVCHNYRRIPAIALAKKMIAEGTLGQLYHYRARYAQDWLVDPETPMRWKLDKSISGSGTHGDINVHIIDLARYLVGEFKEVCGLMETFVKERPIAEGGGSSRGTEAQRSEIRGQRSEVRGQKSELKRSLLTSAPTKDGVERVKVSVDDAALVIGRFDNGALANLEATRYAPGRKNHISLEINGSKGSLYFDFEDMNRLKFFDRASPEDRQGFRDILVLQPGGVHPYVNHWWRAGHPIGYEHTFIHAVADFVNACIEQKPVQPTFEDGCKNQRVLQAVEESVKSRKWVKV